MRLLKKSGLICIRSGKLLLCKGIIFPDLILPGGTAQVGETTLDTLRREVFEELGNDIVLPENGLVDLGEFEDAAAGRRDTNVRIHAYYAILEGTPKPSAEIQELIWFDPEKDDWTQLSAIIQNKILPFLLSNGYFLKDK